ncbi:MAG: prepilin peptidase [Planctomycetota bacterium]
MIWYYYAGLFLFGLTAGSFLNVVIYRLPKGKSLVRPGSFCPKCQTHIQYFDNVPILSFLMLGARCRACKAPISWRYPAVELLTGLLFLWLAYDFLASGLPLPILGVYLYLTLGLIVLSFVDYDLEIIPDEISLVGIPVALVLSMAIPDLHRGVPFLDGLFGHMPAPLAAGISSLAGIAAGGGSLWFIGAVARVILKKDAMGFGDVKLMAMVGGLLGWLNMALAFFIACGIGSVIGIIIMIRTKNRRIPFGPFLAAGTFLVMLYGNEIVYFITDVYPRFLRGVMGIE